MSKGLSMETLNQKSDCWKLLNRSLPAMQVFDHKKASVGWWDALKCFTFEQVEKAINRLLQTGKKAPVPADAVAIILEDLEVLWLSPDEAWAIVLILEDEDRSAFTSDAIIAATTNLKELIASDKIAGRMAFKAAYERLKKHWSSIGRLPVVSFSAGHDKAEREAVAEAAITNGFLTREQVAHYLPAPTAKAHDLVRIAHTSASINPMAKQALEGLKKLVGASDYAKQQKWRTPDRVWEQDGVMYVQFGDEIKTLDELDDRRAA